MKEKIVFFPEIQSLLDLYQEIDVKLEKFKKETNLNCVKGCGECCHIPSERIEVTMVEFIPLSLQLWETGEAELFLEKVYRITQEEPCVFYRRDAYRNEGHCSIYLWRPLICRLFGFSAIEDKYGQPKIVICSVLKKNKPEIAEEINMRLERRELEVPINSYYAKRVALLPPLYNKKLLPINEAIKRAIEWVGYRLQFEKEKKNVEHITPYDRAA